MENKKLELLNKANKVLNKKKETSRRMNEMAKIGETEFNIKKEAFLRMKDYTHYKGAGWVDGDPLKKDPEIPVRFPDRVSPIFIKLYDLISDLSSIGYLGLIEPYLESLYSKGITISIDIPQAPLNQGAVDLVYELDGYQNTICNLANEIRDNFKPEAEKLGLTPKRDFDKVLEIHNKMVSGLDVGEQAHKLITENLATNEATELVLNETDVTVYEGEDNE